jgi:hypothetical protein
MKPISKIILPVYLLTALYAIVRYHVFGPVLWQDVFVFTLNKIIVFSSVIFLLLLSLNVLNHKIRQILQKIIFLSIPFHIILSLLIIKPYYLSIFFNELGGFTIWANISLLFGSLAAVLYIFKQKIDLSFYRYRQLFLTLVAIHLAAMGWQGWVKPAGWHGAKPPITLISFIFVLLALILLKKPEKV